MEAEYWSMMGRQWALNAEALNRQLAPAGEAGIAALAPQPGEAILDLGCGSGATCAALAAAVGPSGRVTGVDISTDQIAAARARPDCAGCDFVVGDAQAHGFAAGAYDALFSRFGCMFFTDPPAAFANLRRALKPGSRAVLLAWAAPAKNPWAGLPAAAAAEVLGPAEPPAPGASGPFAWADPATFRAALEGGGFSGLDWREQALELTIGASGPADPVERAATMTTRIGPLARRLKGQPPEVADEVVRRLRPKLADHVRDGWVRLPGVIWLIRATA